VIQYFAPYSRFHFLIFEGPVFQSVTENCFQTELYGFDQRTAMVADASFPAFANVANPIITLKSRIFAVAMSLDLRGGITCSIPRFSNSLRTFHGTYAPSHLVAYPFQQMLHGFCDKNIVAEPERHVESVDQRLVVFCPVFDFERHACFRAHD